MSFANSTPYTALDIPMLDARGREVVIAVVKAAFEVLPTGALVPAEKPAELAMADECYERDEPRSSIKVPTDVCVEKRGTDVVVIGHAISRKPVTVMDLAVKVRGVTAPLRVHGERLFYKGAVGVAIGPAARFERVPIVYERAYGGASEDYTVMEARNPSGVGVAKRKSDLVDTRAPQIEHPAHPHTSASDEHPPVGYGAIWSHWSPRRELAGTFDQAWLDTRMPLMPLDWDPGANNVAHPSLIFDPPLAPGDEISIVGMSLSGVLNFRLPRLPIVIRARFDRTGRVEQRPPIDTVIIRPEEGRVEVVARHAFPLGRARDVLREIRVELEGTS
jgi:hypothetical protein